MFTDFHNSSSTAGDTEFLNDKHWMNVQDPIKQMFSSFSKALRIQGAGLRDLDTKCSNYITLENCKKLLRDQFEMTCSKADATQLIYQIENKANVKEFNALEDKMNQVSGEYLYLFAVFVCYSC
jgi:hypothetical protein